MSTIEIEYCVPCGFRERALDVQEAVLGALENELDAVRLTMGDHGVFTVSVDGTTVFDKESDPFDIDAIVRDAREAL